MLKKEEAKQIILDHNEMIDDYINNKLIKRISKDGKINASEWFKAQELLKAQAFFEKARGTQKYLRAAGFDVKMNMQDNKLVCKDLEIF